MGLVVSFSDPIVLHEFEDGWRLYDLRTLEDLDVFGKAMGNCWTGGDYGNWVSKVLPPPTGEDERAVVLEAARKRWDRPEYRKAHGDPWVEAMIETDSKKPGQRNYKLVALVDAEGILRAGASLGWKDVLPNITYGSCDGLHQQMKSWVTLDGYDLCVLELQGARLAGSYARSLSGEPVEHFIEWYQSACSGEWQESKALDTVRALVKA